METREWTIVRNGRQLKVQLQHDPSVSSFDVSVSDRTVVVRSSRNVDGSSALRFTIMGDPATITVRAIGSGYTYEFEASTPGGGKATTGTTNPTLPRAPTPPSPTPPGPLAPYRSAPESTPLRSPLETTPLAVPFPVDDAPEVPEKKRAFPAVWLILLLIIVGLGALMAFYVREQNVWKPVQEASLGVSAEFPPGTVDRAKNRGLLEFREGTAETESLSSTALNARWSIDVSSLKEPANVDVVFDSVLENLRAQHIVTKSERSTDTPPRLDVELMTSKGPLILRLVVTPDRIYAIHVSSVLAVRADLRKRFFDSIQLSGGPAFVTKQ